VQLKNGLEIWWDAGLFLGDIFPDLSESEPDSEQSGFVPPQTGHYSEASRGDMA